MTTEPGDPGASIRLRLQEMPALLRVLTLSSLAVMRSGTDTFATKDVRALEGELRIPPVGNLSAALGRLRGQDLLVRGGGNTWALTPKGEARLASEAAHVPPEALAASLDSVSGSVFGARKHALVPPLLAPAGSGQGLRTVLETSSFDTNVMLITRFPKGPEDHYTNLIPLIRKAVGEHNHNLLVASDRVAEETLWANVVTHMWASKYAIVLVDTFRGVLTPNVLIEIGGMLMTGRRCAILRDESVPEIPSDLVGHIYKPVALSDHKQVVETIHGFLHDDVGTPACKNCPKD